MSAVHAACGPPPLQHTFESPEAAARAVLEALAARDAAALRRLTLDEAEFRDHIWPSLPAARPERNLPLSYVWGDLNQKSGTSLTRTLEEHGGRRFQLEEVVLGPSTEYAAFKTHARTMLRVREAGGEPRDIRVFGSLVEKNGRWKVFSYVSDD
jgi:hypothetical protein